MKKKFLAGIAAIATALTMCFALTACNDKGAENEKPVGDDSVNSEETWVKAFDDSLAATNYKFTQKVTITGKDYNDDDELVNYVQTDIGEVSYDGVGFKAYTYSEGSNQLGDDEPTKYNVERYFEVSGSAFNRYTHNEDDDWYAAAEEYDTEDGAKEYFERYVHYSGLGSIIRAQYMGTGDNEEVMGSLAEIYSLFSYDSKTHVYSATVKPVSSYADYKISVQISFKDGKVYKIISDFSQGEDDEAVTAYVEETVIYGGISITIPQEAKDALETEEE